MSKLLCLAFALLLLLTLAGQNASLLADEDDDEYGDAPESVMAYPSIGVLGTFPTCKTWGPSAWVIHQPTPPLWAYFGPLETYETDGNRGWCLSTPPFPPYDADECYQDGDAGLLFPEPYTIDFSGSVVPCTGYNGYPMQDTCHTAYWGGHLDIWVEHNGSPAVPAYVNVLFDWNRDGYWSGNDTCWVGGGPTLVPEHVLVDQPIGPGFKGPLSWTAPRPFVVGPEAGYVWARFTISEGQVFPDWNGEGSFEGGETEDYLIEIGMPPEGVEYGDAPEDEIAYPVSGIIGQFPTCILGGSQGWVQHLRGGQAYFGLQFDYEVDGNSGACALTPPFPPYDLDECFQDFDAGLIMPPSFTIQGGAVVPCRVSQVGALGEPCSTAVWGTDVDIYVNNTSDDDMYVNFLADWDQDGWWAGSQTCPYGTADEHALVDFPVPSHFSGALSLLGPPPFTIGPDSGYVWTRFTIAPTQVGSDWNGEGYFDDGESEDYLLAVGTIMAPADYGDAPEDELAYPDLALYGSFPTCRSVGMLGWVEHAFSDSVYFGPLVDYEYEGNGDSCFNMPPFPPYDVDECFLDPDAGLIMPSSFTIQGGYEVPCVALNEIPIGAPCSTAVWGRDIDIDVTNYSNHYVYVNLLADWNRDGWWAGLAPCPVGAAQEHALVDFPVPAGFSGALSLLGPPSFMIGPMNGYVWTRFTVASAQIGSGWDGQGSFDDGESEDYLLWVDEMWAGVKTETQGGAFGLYPGVPNPFTGATAIRFELATPERVKLAIFDASGRLVRLIMDEYKPAGRHEAFWDGTDTVGNRASAGVYFCRMEAGSFTKTHRTVLVR